MAIEERTIKATKPGTKDQWEIKATGKDVAALAGLMKEAADECNARNERTNKDRGMIELETQSGKRDIFREDQAKRMQRKGYAPTRKSFVIPELSQIDWEK